MRAEKQHVVQTFGHAYDFAQQPPEALTGVATIASDGTQHDEADASPLAQPPAFFSATVRSFLLLPYSGTDPSERKLSQAMPCGSVTQYLSDLA